MLISIRQIICKLNKINKIKIQLCLTFSVDMRSLNVEWCVSVGSRHVLVNMTYRKYPNMVNVDNCIVNR